MVEKKNKKGEKQNQDLPASNQSHPMASNPRLTNVESTHLRNPPSPHALTEMPSPLGCGESSSGSLGSPVSWRSVLFTGMLATERVFPVSETQLWR